MLLYIHISHIHVIYNYSNIWPIYILTPSRAPPKCCKRKIYLGSLLLEHYLWYSDVICCGLLPWQRCMYMSGIDWLGLMRGKCNCTFAQLLFPHLSFLARLSYSKDVHYYYNFGSGFGFWKTERTSWYVMFLYYFILKLYHK